MTRIEKKKAIGKAHKARKRPIKTGHRPIGIGLRSSLYNLQSLASRLHLKNREHCGFSGI
jgi:hypothetical protein